MQSYKFRDNTGRGLIQLSASNHNDAAEKLAKLVKHMEDWRLEEFK